MAKTIGVSVEVKVEDIENLLDCASRGSRYWSSDVSELGYESTVKKLISGKPLTITNDEDDGKKLVLTFEDVKRGLQVLAEKEGRAFGEILSGDEDDNTGDMLLQCALFGEVQYS